MGPRCPTCEATYEWTCGELEELVVGPKLYFCHECRGLFILSADEVNVLQQSLRSELEKLESMEDDDELEDTFEPDPETEPEVDLERVGRSCDIGAKLFEIASDLHARLKDYPLDADGAGYDLLFQAAQATFADSRRHFDRALSSLDGVSGEEAERLRERALVNIELLESYLRSAC